MYLTIKQQVKHLSKEDYRSIKELCHIAKNLTNSYLQYTPVLLCGRSVLKIREELYSFKKQS